MLASTGWDIVYLVVVLASLAAGVIAGRRKPKVANLDDALQNAATRGGYAPVVIGQARLGFTVGWVEDATGTDGAPGAPGGGQPGFGKGSSAPSTADYYENALHIICVGPASKLIAIFQNGEAIWSGPITPQSHPSGSTISAGSEGTFRVYWGFPDDPTIPELADSPSHGIATRYSLVLKVLWVAKNLKQSRLWPRLEYEVECPCYSQITSTAAEMPPEADDALPTWLQANLPGGTGGVPLIPGNGGQGAAFTIDSPAQFHVIDFFDLGGGRVAVAVLQNGLGPDLRPYIPNFARLFPSDGVVKLWVFNNQILSGVGWGQAPTIPLPGTQVRGVDIGLPQGRWEYRRIKVTTVYNHDGGGINGIRTTSNTIFNACMLIELGPPFPSARVENQEASAGPWIPTPGINHFGIVGIAEPVRASELLGVNPIHMIDQLMFAEYPWGARKDRSKFDPISIEQAALTVEQERIRGAVTVADGESLLAVLADLLLDVGLFISWDPEIGKNVFVVLRYDDPNNVTDLPPEMILKPPEMAAVRGPRPVDVIAFTFNNRERNYREDPLTLTDHGQVERAESQRARKVPIRVTNDAESAARMVPRREMEALANISTMLIQTNHGTQMAIAGRRVSATATEGEGLLFRILSVRRYADSNKVELETILDAYDPPPSTATGSYGQDGPPDPNLGLIESPFASPVTDLGAIELPRALSGGSIKLLLPAYRSSKKTISSAVWGSSDGTAFEIIGNSNIVAAGELVQALSSEGAVYDDSGSYQINALGVDFGDIEDLNLNETAWRAGRQVLLIGDEVIYLRSGTSSTIDGLLRGRLGTAVADHAIGTRFVIFLSHNASFINPPLLLPGRTLYYKQQAVERGRVSDLDTDTVNDITIQGTAFTPTAPSGLRQISFRPDYDAAGTITLVWNYHSDEFPHTGMGAQGAGQASGISTPKGHFVVTIRNNAGDVVEKRIATLPEVAITPAERAPYSLDTSGEWSVEVAHVEGSYSSTTTSVTLIPS